MTGGRGTREQTGRNETTPPGGEQLHDWAATTSHHSPPPPSTTGTTSPPLNEEHLAISSSRPDRSTSHAARHSTSPSLHSILALSNSHTHAAVPAPPSTPCRTFPTSTTHRLGPHARVLVVQSYCVAGALHLRLHHQHRRVLRLTSNFATDLLQPPLSRFNCTPTSLPQSPDILHHRCLSASHQRIPLSGLQPVSDTS